MRGSRGLVGIVLGLGAGLAFGAGGVFVKPLLESGWSPGAAVLARISIAALLLAVPGLIALRFDLRPLWRARWTILLYGLVAVAGVQFAFYASLERIPVSMTLLIEYLAPIALVLFAWARTRRMPQLIVLGGSVLAIGGLVLVIGPGGGDLDPLGLAFAAAAMIGVCVYYAIGERAAEQLPPVALVAAGFVVGAVALAITGAVGLLPMEASFTDVPFLGGTAPWWVLLLTVGAISTAFAYLAGIAAIRMLGARLSSFLGLSEVVFAGVVGWILLGEALGPLQILGGVLILGGIVLVRMERTPADAASVALDIDLVPATVDPTPSRPTEAIPARTP
ncbi:drug/metabolite transporter (DMT)-like permease [Agromyces flavus]|uniref:Drug/metabolite transporter (DMT)-like permease n=1 Tax=Agromyces flavus TaxID=589382 RepID=A0A1H1TBC5_9MICO|nr:EamA family transporter [Agromyces flavus]MCP2368457.1 drug/metabolite transporter (DMT)-like permease [Agromyces flavus]GGI47917.1 membrane protein [Agromyces flavus]SDS57520.1 Threonine/homoserine efflux transporter RhtA [Agromyces flavus]